MRDYELVLLLPTDEKGDKKTLELVKGFVVKEKGKVFKVDNWGVKPLAYPIKKQTEAIYSILHISLEPPSVTQLDRTLRMNEEVLRHLILIREGEVAPLDPSAKLRARGKQVSKVSRGKIEEVKTGKVKKINSKESKSKKKKKAGKGGEK